MNSSLVEIIAWVSVGLCVFATVHCANFHARKKPRLFECLVFFALCWVVLIPYYGLQHLRSEWKANFLLKEKLTELQKNSSLSSSDLEKLTELQKSSSLSPSDFQRLTEIIELFPAYSGLLLTLAGGPLRREAVTRERHHDPGIGWVDVWVLRALYLTIVPHILVIAPLGVSIDMSVETLRIMGVAFTFLGFYSILQGLRKLTLTPISEAVHQLRAWWVLVAVVVCYIVTEVAYTSHLLPRIREEGMTDGFKICFAILKLTFVGVFLYAVIRETQDHHPHKAKHILAHRSRLTNSPGNPNARTEDDLVDAGHAMRRKGAPESTPT